MHYFVVLMVVGAAVFILSAVFAFYMYSLEMCGFKVPDGDGPWGKGTTLAILSGVSLMLVAGTGIAIEILASAK